MDIQKTAENILDKYNATIQRKVFLGEDGQDLSQGLILRDTLCGVWKALVEHYNLEFGSSRRKPVDAVVEEASRRGFTMKQSGPGSDVWFISKGELVFTYRKRNGSRYLSISHNEKLTWEVSSFRVTLESSPLLDCIEEFIASIPGVRDTISRRFLKFKRENTVDRISYPTLCGMAEDYLSSRNIKYYMCPSPAGAVLNVNIISNIWFSGPVDIGSIEGILRLVPYGVKRPDCIKRDISRRFGARTDHFGRMEKEWKAYRLEMEKLKDSI